MRNHLKKLAKRLFFGIKKISDSIIMLLSVLMFSRYLPRKWRRTDAPIAVILGNGPSLSDDIHVLINRKDRKDLHLWSVNNFCCSEYFETLKPDFYVITDSIYWIPSTSPRARSIQENFLSAINSKVCWNMTLLLPASACQSHFTKLISNRFVKVAHYNNTPVRGSNRLSHILFKYGAVMPITLNVMIAAISLAVGCYYRKIFILGADHSWHEKLTVSQQGEALIVDLHFYAESTGAQSTYRPDMTTFTVGDLFIRWGEVFKCYELLRKYADLGNIDIINISSKTYIDAFRRLNAQDMAPHD